MAILTTAYCYSKNPLEINFIQFKHSIARINVLIRTMETIKSFLTI